MPVRRTPWLHRRSVLLKAVFLVSFGVGTLGAPLAAQVGPGAGAGAGERAALALPVAPSSLLASAALPGQQLVTSAAPRNDGDRVTLLGTPWRIVKDEGAVVTSPARLRAHDLLWLVPLAGGTAAAFATDTRAMRDVVTSNGATNASADNAANALRDTFIAVPAGLFVLGQFGADDHARETGILGGEAVIDASLVGLALKLTMRREGPALHNADGAFFQRDAGWNSSFPSGHALIAWSSAAVLAGEYNRPWQQVAAYTLAGGVSFTRVLGRDHFPSDALVGSAAGWLIGHYVYRAHHRHGDRR